MTTTDRENVTARSFPMARRCPFAPPPEYEEMRAEGPLVPVTLPTGQVIWVVTRHEEARQVLSDPRVSTDSTRPGFPTVSQQEDGDAAAPPGFFIDMDPPDHDVYRKMLISEFSVRRVNATRPTIQRVVDSFIDDMVAAGSPADLVDAYGLPIPSLVICELLGVPYEDHEYFQSRARTILRAQYEPADAARARNDIIAYLTGLVTRAQRDPGDNVIGRLITGPVANGQLSPDELAGMAMLLLFAGHETTANMIPLGVITLLEHPSQLAELRADPSLWPSAVEELLRYHSIVDWAGGDRMAIEDLDIGGTPVRAGDGIYVLNASASRDARVFDDPDRFDIHRGARNHVAFGYGVHQCLGQNLARAELEIACRTLFERIPTLRVAPDESGKTPALEDLPFKYDLPIFGLYDLPVTW